MERERGCALLGETDKDSGKERTVAFLHCQTPFWTVSVYKHHVLKYNFINEVANTVLG